MQNLIYQPFFEKNVWITLVIHFYIFLQENLFLYKIYKDVLFQFFLLIFLPKDAYPCTKKQHKVFYLVLYFSLKNSSDCNDAAILHICHYDSLVFIQCIHDFSVSCINSNMSRITYNVTWLHFTITYRTTNSAHSV